MGGKSYECDDCHSVTEVFHSCGDHHCPQCSGCKRYDFAARAEELILPGVTYYQDYDPAAMMVLHTWNQQLHSHWHVHALVPGGGPSLSQDQWKSAQSPPGAVNSDDYYLVDAISLRESFRKAAIARLRRLYANKELKLSVLTHCDERCPEWYAQSEYTEFCAYLEREYGISYEDWDLETRIESTMDQLCRSTTSNSRLTKLCRHQPLEFATLILRSPGPTPRGTMAYTEVLDDAGFYIPHQPLGLR